MEEMEIDWPYLKEGERERTPQNGHDFESSRQRETGKTKTVVETYSDKRAGEHQENME